MMRRKEVGDLPQPFLGQSAYLEPYLLFVRSEVILFLNFSIRICLRCFNLDIGIVVVYRFSFSNVLLIYFL